MNGSVFISHAVKDKKLVNALTDLLMVGVGLQQSQVFVSSLAGLGIPAGHSFKDYVGEKLNGAPTVIALLTPNYYSSAFCLCEAGATWILCKDFIPMLTPSTQFSEMKAVLEGTQALRIDEETALDEMRERLQPLVTQQTKDAWWTVKKKEFLAKLPDILRHLPKPETPTAEDHKTVVKDRDAYKEVTEDLQAQLETLQQKYEAVKKLKDHAAVRATELSFSDDEEQFETLEAEAKRTLGKVSREVAEALFHRERGERWMPGLEWGDRLTSDLEHERLFDEGGMITVAEEHPVIRPIIKAIENFRAFVDSASEEFVADYEEGHSEPLSFTSRGFWKRHLK